MEIKTLEDIIKSKPNRNKLVSVPNGKDINKCYFFCGNSCCSSMTELTFKIIEVLALKLYITFPDRKERRLPIADGCMATGDTCEGHAAHAGGYRIDFNYLTYETCLTQYVPMWKNRNRSTEKGRSMFLADQEMIWKTPQEAKGLLPIFDWERNFLFYYWIADIFPYAEILVHKNIVSRLRTEASKKYLKEWKQIERNIRPDGSTDLNHHTHVHCDFGSSGVPTGFEVDWKKERKWLKCKI